VNGKKEVCDKEDDAPLILRDNIDIADRLIEAVVRSRRPPRGPSPKQR
jgi:hypothetical protein